MPSRYYAEVLTRTWAKKWEAWRLGGLCAALYGLIAYVGNFPSIGFLPLIAAPLFIVFKIPNAAKEIDAEKSTRIKELEFEISSMTARKIKVVGISSNTLPSGDFVYAIELENLDKTIGLNFSAKITKLADAQRNVFVEDYALESKTLLWIPAGLRTKVKFASFHPTRSQWALSGPSGSRVLPTGRLTIDFLFDPANAPTLARAVIEGDQVSLDVSRPEDSADSSIAN